MALTSAPPINYNGLIREDEKGFWVSGRLYQDPAIFEEEMEKIFYQGWSFVGHDSEIPEPGDYVTRWIGRQPIIMTRDEDGQVHLLMNRCAHRSAAVCQDDHGNSSYFACSYHGWTYNNRGELVGVTFPKGYEGTLQREEFGLARVPRMGIHRGFIFASLTISGQGFDDYLGRARDYLDRLCDLAPDGEIVLGSGRLRTRIAANWKFLPENLTDSYHFTFTHVTAYTRGSQRGQNQTALQRREDSLSVKRDLGGGHTVTDSFQESRSRRSNTLAIGTMHPAVVESVAKRLGSREKAEHMLSGGSANIQIFPNLLILGPTVRLIQPVSVNETHHYHYPSFLKGAPDEVNQERLHSTVEGWGPAGFIGPDDADNWTRSQVGTMARAPGREWTVLNRGRIGEHLEPDEFGVPTLTDGTLNETTQRGIWRHYKNVMLQP